MRSVVCVGATSIKTMGAILADDGLKRPYRVVTMDPVWFEVAAVLGRPRFLFKDKLRMMRYLIGREIVCIEAKDGTEETASMGASMFTMNALSLPIASDEEI